MLMPVSSRLWLLVLMPWWCQANTTPGHLRSGDILETIPPAEVAWSNSVLEIYVANKLEKNASGHCAIETTT